MTTTSRQLTLLSLLQTRRDWPGSLLASRLGITDRTVRGDIDRLREMGYRIEATMGPDGGYRLDSGAELPPLLFDDDQALAVAIALRTAPALGAGIGEAAIRALATMRQVMPSRLRHRLDTLEVTTVARPGEVASTGISLDVLVTLAQAIRDRVTLRFEDGDALRRAEPHHLAVSHGRCVGSRPRRLADLPGRSPPSAHPARCALHTAHGARRRRRRVRLRPIQGSGCQRLAVPRNGSAAPPGA